MTTTSTTQTLSLKETAQVAPVGRDAPRPKHLVRLALGLEDAEDLIADLGQALDCIR